MTPIIQVDHASKIFSGRKGNKSAGRGFQALHDIHFSVPAGQAVGFVGGNGSGKTTLLRIIAGILRPTSGHVRVTGKVIGFFELGSVFHEDLSVVSNILLYGALVGRARLVRRQLETILDFAELSQFSAFAFKDLSQGMRARMALSTIAHCDPDIFIIDEALAVGDEHFREKSHALFSKLKTEGKTLLITSHDPSVIARFCDQALLLQQGRQILFDTTDQVLRAYHRLIGVKE